MSGHLREKLDSLKGQRKYCVDALNIEGLEEWERKEYSGLVEGYDVEIKAIKNHIKEFNL